MVVPAFTGFGDTPLSVGAATASLLLTVKLLDASVVPLPTVAVQVRLPVQVSVLATTVGCTPSDVAVCVTIWVEPPLEVVHEPLLCLVHVAISVPCSSHLMVVTVFRFVPDNVSCGA